ERLVRGPRVDDAEGRREPAAVAGVLRRRRPDEALDADRDAEHAGALRLHLALAAVLQIARGDAERGPPVAAPARRPGELARVARDPADGHRALALRRHLHELQAH